MNSMSPYTNENYASPFAPGKSIFPEQRRIFHRADRIYTPLYRIEQVQRLDAAVHLTVAAKAQLKAYLRIAVVGPGLVRLRMSLRPFEAWDEPYFLVQDLKPYGPTEILEDEESLTLAWDSYRLRIERHPLHLALTRDDELIWELDREETAGGLMTGPLGFRWQEGQAEAYLSTRLQSGEECYGFGEKWGRLEKTGTSLRIWNNDTCGTNTTDLAYKAVPWLMSTKGWGLLLSSAYASQWEIGSFSHSSASCLVEHNEWSGFLCLGRTLKDLVKAYTALSGRPGPVPDWALGIWMSRCAYRNRAEVEEVAEQLRRLEIPSTVLHLDPPWMQEHYYPSLHTDACDFRWNERDFPKRRDMFAALAKKGFAVSLWINPYLPEGGELYRYAEQQGFLVRSLTGSWARLEFGQPVGIVDFTSPEASSWWQGLIEELLRDGAATVKADYADRIPEDALFADGRSGREMHHIYLHLFAEAAASAVQTVHGHGVIWRRPGYIGTQRFPISWAGDTQVSWEGMRGCLRGGLSAALAGEAFWSHDIGGFCGPQPDPELYIRWMQWGMLSPCTRFHGTSPREPWHYGSEALAITRHYARLRQRLLPYLKECAELAQKEGLPILRPMVLEFQDEPGMSAIEDQYMLGPQLLVAPILQAGQRERWVYLPQGAWRALEDATKQIYEGGRYIKAEAPLERLPLFLRLDGNHDSPMLLALPNS